MSYEIHEANDQSVALSLNWDAAAAQAVSATIALVAPSTHLWNGPGPIDQQSVAIQSGNYEVRLAPSYRLPTGLYYIRVQVGSIDRYLRPIWISAFERSYDKHDFGQLTPSIGLASAQVQQLDRDHFDVLLNWSVSETIGANYGISLRLRDTSGKVWTSLDTQPGYGFQPTSAWQPGAIDDAYTLNLPADMSRDSRYSLDVIVYRVAAQQEVGRTTIDGIRLDSTYAWRSIEPPPRSFSAPSIEHRLDAIFDHRIQLLGYNFAQDAGTLRLNLIWQAARNIDANYKVFVHVFDPTNETIAAQSDVMPRNNTYPTSRWIEGEVISDTIAIPLTNVLSGSYRVAIGLFDETGRLSISGAIGIDAAHRRVILDETVEVR